MLLLLSQTRVHETIGVIDHIEQSRKTPVVVKAAFHVREEPAQWRRAHIIAN
jgi:hypothetical protein